MNLHETDKKLHFSCCVDRCIMRDHWEGIYRDIITCDEGDVITLNFGSLEVHIVVIDESEDDSNG